MKRQARLVAGAFLGGVLLYYPWMAAVASAHNHGLAPWLVAFLPQLCLGFLLGAVRRWAPFPLALGMMVPPIVYLSAASKGALAAYILAAGWPVALAGLLALALTGHRRQRSAA